MPLKESVFSVWYEYPIKSRSFIKIRKPIVNNITTENITQAQLDKPLKTTTLLFPETQSGKKLSSAGSASSSIKKRIEKQKFKGYPKRSVSPCSQFLLDPSILSI